MADNACTEKQGRRNGVAQKWSEEEGKFFDPGPLGAAQSGGSRPDRTENKTIRENFKAAELTGKESSSRPESGLGGTKSVC